MAPVLLFGLQSTSSAQTDDPTLIRIATSPIDSASEPYYADDKGFFRSAGLNVQVQSISNGPAIAAAVASGAIDIGVGSSLPLALAHQRGIPFVIIFPGGIYSPQAPTTVLMVAKDSPIRSASDLDGKTIGTQALQSIAQLAPETWIDSNGGNSKTVRFVEMASAEMSAAIKHHRVDAIVAIEPSVAKAKRSARVLGDVYQALPAGFAINVWFTTQRFAEAHPALIVKLRDTIRTTAKWANAHHRESGIILEKYAKITPATVNDMVRSTYGEALSANIIQPNIDIAAKYGLLQRPFDASELLLNAVTK